MGAYCFNEDKSKAAIIQTITVTPTTGETWKAFSERFWGILSDLNHVVCIHADLFKMVNGENLKPSISIPYNLENDSLPDSFSVVIPWLDEAYAYMGAMIIHKPNYQYPPSNYWTYYTFNPLSNTITKNQGGTSSAVAKGIANSDLHFKVDFIA